MKKILILIFLFICSNYRLVTTLSEINEKAKGDGVPYIPGI